MESTLLIYILNTTKSILLSCLARKKSIYRSEKLYTYLHYTYRLDYSESIVTEDDNAATSWSDQICIVGEAGLLATMSATRHRQ